MGKNKFLKLLLKRLNFDIKTKGIEQIKKFQTFSILSELVLESISNYN